MKNVIQQTTGTAIPTTTTGGAVPFSSVGTSAPLSTGGLATHVGEVSRAIHVEPTVLLEKRERPVVVKETILPQEKIEVQPVIHREREQLEVHEVFQPLRERDVAPTSVRHATLPAQVRAEVRESDAAFQTTYREASSRHIPEVHTQAVQREFVNRAPIVEEHVHRRIVEEVQPVLYKETIAPVVIEETQPIYEKIVEAPRIFEEVKPMVDLGTRYTQVPSSSLGYHSTQVPISQMENLTIGGQPMVRETVITKETFGEPAQRASTFPPNEAKRIV